MPDHNQNATACRAPARGRFLMLACGLAMALAGTTGLAQDEGGSDVVQPKQVEHACRPSYPSMSKLLGESGRAVVKVLVDRDGAPSKVEIAESSGNDNLDNGARAVASCFRFQPGTRAGVPTDMWVRIPIDFRFTDPPPRLLSGPRPARAPLPSNSLRNSQLLMETLTPPSPPSP